MREMQFEGVVFQECMTFNSAGNQCTCFFYFKQPVHDWLSVPEAKKSSIRNIFFILVGYKLTSCS